MTDRATPKPGLETYDSLVAATLDFVYLFDLEGRFRFVNKPLLDLWGLTLEQAVGKNFHELPYPAALAERLQQQIRTVIECKNAVRDETSYTAPSGQVGYYEYILTPVIGEHGDVEAVAGTTRDFTHRKAQELELRDARTRLDVAIRAGEMGTWVLELLEGRVYGDANLNRMFGVADDAMHGAELEDYLVAIHPDDRSRVTEAIAQAIAHGDAYEAEYRLCNHERERWVVARGLVERGPDRQPLRLPGVVLDITSRKRVEEALRASEERYRDLFTTIDQGFCVIDMIFDEHDKPLDYRFLETNPAFEKQTGLVSAVGKTARELVPGLEDHWFSIYGAVALTGETAVFEDGSAKMQRWFTVEAFRIGGADSRKVAILCKDITASKLAELSLRESEARFRNMSDHSSVLIWVTRSDGRCEYLNRRWFEFTGQPEEAALGFGWLAALHPDDAEQVRRVFFHANERHLAFQLEYRLRRADGEYRWCIDAGTPRFAENGAFLGFIGSVLDVTEQRRAIESVRDSEERVRGIFEQATAGIAQCDLHGTFVEVNDHYCQIVGRARAELLGLNMLDVIGPEHAENARMKFVEVVRTGAPMRLERQYRRGDGGLVWANISVSRVSDSSGRPRSVVAVAVDITLRKQAEDRLREVALERERLLVAERSAREEAERTSRVKDEFLATLSHELRTPLNAILGWSQVMRQRAADPEEVSRGLAVIERNARAQAQIIEDLLDMSRIIAGKIRLDVQPLDLPAIVRSAIDTARPAADAKNISLVETLDALSGLTVTGDGNRLHQVLWNLLSNAVKFTPKGGRVEVLLRRDGSHLQIDIVDSGEGIAPDFVGFVFDRFRQADATTTRRHGGLGLGLAIVKQLVELHGGSIGVRSDGVGRGSTFSVLLPLLTRPSEAEPEPEGMRKSLPPGAVGLSYRTNELRGLRVLVVDDEPDARALVKRVLEDNDASVSAVDSVGAALQLLSRERFDLIVSDIGMPHEDGYSLIRKVRALAEPTQRAIKAIAVTAYARAEDRVKALRSGYQMHLVKPIEPSELVAVVASPTGRASAPS
ncbi:MAG: Multi-sensor Hybrid Histidine Kinase [Myxococcaceae bacterium]|nr:Multi-sensor Hybrid Histidine Kinase [Myxococcaceae bacterium]